MFARALILTIMFGSASYARAESVSFIECAQHPFADADDSGPGNTTQQRIVNSCDTPIRAVICCLNEARYSCTGKMPFARVLLIPPKRHTVEPFCRKFENVNVDGCAGEDRVLDYEFVDNSLKVTCGPKQ